MNKKTKTLLRENNEFEKNLNKESVEILTDIVVYLRGCDISEYHQEEVRRDIMQMVYYGEKRNEAIIDIIGEDYKSFCDEIVKSFPPRSKKEKFLYWASLFFQLLGILSLIWFSSSIAIAFSGKTTIYRLPLTLGNIISSILIILFSISIVNFICKTSFDKSLSNSSIKTFFIAWLILFLIFGSIVLMNYFLKSELLNIPFYIGAILIITSFILSKILSNLQE